MSCTKPFCRCVLAFTIHLFFCLSHHVFLSSCLIQSLLSSAPRYLLQNFLQVTSHAPPPSGKAREVSYQLEMRPTNFSQQQQPSQSKIVKPPVIKDVSAVTVLPVEVPPPSVIQVQTRQNIQVRIEN